MRFPSFFCFILTLAIWSGGVNHGEGQTVPNPNIVFFADFDQHPVGSYTDTELDVDFNNPPWEKGVDEGRVSISGGQEAYYGNALCVTYPQGTAATSTNGGSWYCFFPGSYDELYFSYRIRFSSGFDFKLGGKLPGLAGGTAVTGCDIPTGTDGWSARYMWLSNGTAGSPTTGTSANMISYLYHPDNTGSCGENTRWDDGPTGWFEVVPDRWYQFEARVKMNTVGSSDGLHEMWVDGVKVLSRTGLRYRDVPSLQIDLFYFSTFFGGNSAPWHPSKDEYIYFDDFVASTAPIGTTYDDSNNNGIRDAWEMQYFSNLTTASASNDADGDGFNDFEEYHTGHSPIDPADHSQLLCNPLVPYQVSWNTKPQHHYQLERSPDLNSWAPIATPEEGSGALEIENLNPVGIVEEFYRLKIYRQ